MPDPERLLRTLRLARDAFRDTPGRRGHLVELTDAADVLVAGDLHGHVDNFRHILAAADLAQHPRRHLVLQELVHGPFRYPAGGDKSHQLVDLVAALKCQHPARVHLLLGNHELAQWTGEWIAKQDDDLNELFHRGVASAYGPRADAMVAAYYDLFGVVPVAVRTSNRVLLCHSLPTPARLESFDPAVLRHEEWQVEDLRPGGAVYALVWGRNTQAANAARFLDLMDADWLVTGHIACERGFEVPNDRQIILDAKGSPAAFCLFPAEGNLTQQHLLDRITLLS
jgi:hypothetical protein